MYRALSSSWVIPDPEVFLGSVLAAEMAWLVRFRPGFGIVPKKRTGRPAAVGAAHKPSHLFITPHHVVQIASLLPNVEHRRGVGDRVCRFGQDDRRRTDDRGLPPVAARSIQRSGSVL